MCGIFGLFVKNNISYRDNLLKDLVKDLFLLSETRGKEASGLAIKTAESIEVLKDPIPGSRFVKTDKFNIILDKALNEFVKNKTNFSLIGHARLVTNGLQSEQFNNQPVIVDGAVGVHNGIIVNEEDLWKNKTNFIREYEVDTEILFKLLLDNFSRNGDFTNGINSTFNEIKGSATFALFLNKLNASILATNTGSLFFLTDSCKSFFIFASERFILKKLINRRKLKGFLGYSKINQLKANDGLIFDSNSFKFEKIDLQKKDLKINSFLKINLKTNNNCQKIRKLKRCKKCILPHTYPFIDFDKEDICRFCREHIKWKPKGEKLLLERIDPYRTNNGKPDCIVALSGGRDSCYGLHYIKNVLGMNPIAFTYDWGFVTDLARRNAARMCGELGVEHIIRSPDIYLKRKYVRKNIEAWLKRPELGMVPLFMAGDKAFFYHANKLKKETGIKLVFFCTGNDMEETPFKFGFSGLRTYKAIDKPLNGIELKNKFLLAKYYLKQYLLNPSYFNESFIETISAFFATFIINHQYVYLYKYIDWDETNIINTITEKYGWETAKDTQCTWRVGDGLASLYNLIYQNMAGFTEYDDMLSAMIRENLISREEALKKSLLYSKTRKESLLDFSQTIGISYEYLINKIISAKKIY